VGPLLVGLLPPAGRPALPVDLPALPLVGLPAPLPVGLPALLRVDLPAGPPVGLPAPLRVDLRARALPVLLARPLALPRVALRRMTRA
jgi:hypothetical protein